MSLQITYLPIGELTPYLKNPRKNDKAVDIVARSIKEYGFLVPIILDKDKIIVAGHTRLKAAHKLGLTEVPTILAENLTEEQVKGFRIMDNKANEYASWDMDILSKELEDLKSLNFDLELTGFKETELNKMMPSQLEEPAMPDTKIPKYEVKLGEVWQVGKHRVMCGSSTEKANVSQLMGNLKANMVFTDPPYNVDYGAVKNHPSYARTTITGEGKPYCKSLRNNVNNTPIHNDNLSPEDWDKFVIDYMSNLMEYNEGAFYICMSNKEMYSNKQKFEELGGHWATFIIWDKNRFVIGMSDYQRQYEPILYGWKEKGKHYWCGDRNQSDIWSIDRPTSSPEHPTMKPIDLCYRAIINSSQVNDIVLDLFGGSGSTLLASEKSGRVCYMMELDPKYVSVIMERFENMTGIKPIKLTN